jgi:hypothetical protein
MRVVYTIIALAALSAVLPSAVTATDVFVAVRSFSTTYSGGGIHLQFTLGPFPGIYDWEAFYWPADVSQVMVWRHRLVDPCGVATYVTTAPWVNQPDTPFVTVDFVDADVEPNTVYQYLVSGVGGQGLTTDAAVGDATTGPALLGHGTLSSEADCGVSGVPLFVACDNSCYGGLNLNEWPSAAEPYFNTPTTLMVYGEYNGLTTVLCNVRFPVFKITSVVEAPCISAVEATTWGTVKAIYR